MLELQNAKQMLDLEQQRLSFHNKLVELENNMIPFKIKRPLPNNTYEIWELNELQK